MGFDLESLLVRDLIHPLWALRDHPHYRHYRQEAERAQYLSREGLRSLQATRLNAILRQAFEHTAYYRSRFLAAGLTAPDLQHPNCVSRLPILTKTDIQQNIDAMVADNVPVHARVRNQTGGSTGMPVQFYVDLERLDSRMASTARHDAWAGYQPGDWCAYLWGARLDMISTNRVWDRLRNRLLYRRIELNTSGIAPEDWAPFIQQVRHLRPPVMLAYAQAAVLFAKHVVENHIRDIRFRSIITTSEVLFPEQRTLLEDTFGATVFNRYGSREVSVLASECEVHQGMHVNADSLLLEVVPDPEIPEPNGKILVTDLLNRSMPLIRYEIGDAGRLTDRLCACGRTLPLLEDLQGRLTDFLVMPDGKKVSGVALLTWVFADMRGLQHVQLVQERRDAVTMRVVPGPHYDETVERTLLERFAHFLDPRVAVNVERCGEVEISATSGKRRFVINRIPSEGN